MKPAPLRHRPSTVRRTKTASAQAEDVIDVVPAVMDVLRATMRRQLSDRRTVPQYRCLGFITRQPRASVGEVAGFLGVTMATASAMVDRLVRDGLLVSETDPTDRRRVRITASADGRAEMRQVRSKATIEIGRRLSTLPADELQALRAGLKALQHAFLDTEETDA